MAAPSTAGGADAVSIGEIAAIKAHVDRLEAQVAELRATVEALRRDLGA
jgi:outer membrane murein-binding lipoprotein Lpp